MIDIENDLKRIRNGCLSLDPISDVRQIFHYTDINGLKGIFDEGNFRASHSFFLNDSNELKYCYQVAIDILEKGLNSESESNSKSFYKIFLNRINQVLRQEFSSEGIKKRSGDYRSSEYVLSFGLNNDSSYLWNSYAQGCGYNIGFDCDLLMKHFTTRSSFKIIIPGKVIYDIEEQRRILRKKIDEYKDLYIINLSYSYEDKEKLAKNFTSKLRLFCCFFKSEKFKYEEEFRVVFCNYAGREDYIKPKYRIKSNALVPYVYITDGKEKKLPVTSIGIGPLNKLDIAQEGIAYYLSDLGYVLDNIEINVSEIPIRY